MNKLVAAAALSCALIAGAAQAANVAVVDLGRIIKSIPQSEAVQKSLQEEFAPKVKELQDLAKKMTDKQETARRDEALMTDAQKKDLIRELEEMQASLKLKEKALQQDGQLRQREENKKIIVVVQKAITEIAQQGKYDLVVERQTTLFSKPELDISAKVIEHLSKK